MSGGLYRSANATGPDGPPPGDEAVLISTTPPDEIGARLPGGNTQQVEGSAAGNSAIMAIGSLVSRGTGFLRTLVLGAALGGGLVGDAYATAQIFPGMVYEFLLGGVLTSVVVPVLVRRRKFDPDRGQAYAQRLLTLAVVALAAATALAMLCAPLLTIVYATGQQNADWRSLVTVLSYLMIPMVFFTGLSALMGAVLNTRGHFFAPMWAPILNNLVVIGTVGFYIAAFGAKQLAPSQMTPGRIVVLGGGAVLGVMIQAAGLLPALRRVGFRWRLRFDFRGLGLRELARIGVWSLCYVAVSQLGLIVVTNLLNRGGGKHAGPLIYNNVYLLLMMAHGIIGVSVITALMPRMSGAAADGRREDLASDLSRGTRTIAAVLAPVAVIYMVLALPISVVLFQHGAYNRDNAVATGHVLLVAGVALVPFSLSQLYTVVYYAMQDTKTPALVNIPIVVFRVIVQIVLFAWLTTEFAAAGLMLGNAISYVVGFGVSALLLHGRVGRLGLPVIVVSFARIAVAALGAALVGLLVVKVLPGRDVMTFEQGLVQLIVGGAAIGASYLALAAVLRVHEIGAVLALVKGRLRR
ncbi:murein biosynthesis integral membrane protein MurJ [Rhizomonospora bruguierae]|uniref:murein biosynthesis integral membrane protein MurJ n=1 Tax=Rhizomonospora bruguierae TaxID=1581705 RepID=UPI001BD1805E|nr:murein biosynthesis integral membrane protein MurJ [Micromonospora sp. NBRC 107566]